MEERSRWNRSRPGFDTPPEIVQAVLALHRVESDHRAR
ncbi:hypothetical protein HDA32_001444 [Spinactinospora alkalitolerans]|uniref:Uncharacterized protein n=1 Tax=Spinactinospora alkalitolerans TaxID=687207 RepID=A0A852TW73_9ACTN|nr:hypothetical protein [Spinactinospora alkalitolerans]